jgi:hypothetical protein
MLGQMQEWPLLIHKIIDFAGSQRGNREGGVFDLSKARSIESATAICGSGR